MRRSAGRHNMHAARPSSWASLLACSARHTRWRPTAEGERAQLPNGEGGVMFRGRAAVQTGRAGAGPSLGRTFTTCPCENLREPARVHLDPCGNLHICQGIALGNLFATPLRDICAAYDAERHPITAALVAGGPAELVRRYELAHEELYADACHLCDAARQALRERFPETAHAGSDVWGGGAGNDRMTGGIMKIQDAGDVRVAEDNKWLNFPPLCCHRPPPQPSPAAAREGASKFGDHI